MLKVNGVEGSRYKLCSKKFMKSGSSSTFSMKRHLKNCVQAHSGTLTTASTSAKTRRRGTTFIKIMCIFMITEKYLVSTCLGLL